MNRNYIEKVKYLRDLRLSRMSVSEMADLCKVTRQTIYNFEDLSHQSYILVFRYMNILLNKEEIGDFIEKWGE